MNAAAAPGMMPGMQTTDAPGGAPDSLVPVVHGSGEGEHLWFFGGLTTIKADGAATGGRAMITEQRAPRGHGSPLHLHRKEDEWWYVLEGELTLWVDGRTVVAGPGSFVWAPRDVPHTFIVSSDEARFLLGTNEAGMEDFIRTLGTPVDRAELPPAADGPPEMEPVMRAAAARGIEILGPPGIPA